MSGHFSAPLTHLDWIDGEKYRIDTGFRYYLTDNENGEFVDVPDGFVTNFASIPSVLRAIYSPTDKTYAQIAVVHDKLFLAPVIRLRLSARPCAFEETPDIFLDGTRVLGASLFKQRTMYRSLQWFSRGPWNDYREADRAFTLAGSASPAALKKFELAQVLPRIDLESLTSSRIDLRGVVA